MANERIVGIDLGTTNSLVAYMEDNRPVVIPGEDGLNLVPSVVALDENGQIVVGSAARKYLIETPERAVYSVKRLMGRGVEDVQDELKLFPFRLADDLAAGEVLRIKLGDKTFTPPEISAFILRQLKRNAERYFAAPVTKAVITVPAYFNDAQRQATKDAGRIAGLEVLRLVNEPTAASLAYGLDKKNAETVAVYDLGGGTFDISILKLHEGIFEVIATNGDTHLGGDDIDNLLITIALHDIQGDLAVDVRRNAEIVQAIRKAVIDAKIALSSDEKTALDVALPGGKRYQREITRAQFEQLIQPVIDRTVGPVRQAMKDAGLTAKEINEAVLVGGSTRIPRVRQLVEELFQRTPHSGLNPDEVVALGAAIQAHILAGGSEATKEMLLLDVTPLSLGIESLGGGVVKIIHRNSTIPASATEHFTTGVEGQTNVAVHVLQGERELASDCRSLARFDLKGIPPMPAGLPRIEVKFLIDANGILHVSARELRSGKEAEIQVQPSYGLTDEQVENMILESFDNAEEDFRRRQVIEARNEAETMLAALEKGRKNPAWEQLSSQERRNIEKFETALRAVMEADDYQAIRTAIDALNQGTMHLAELMMESAVGTALKGQNIDTADVGEGPESPHPIAQAEIER
ncbi:MAG: Fe-S protein assembly chaperone HscA [Candidatus Korobacteraceae bacterium]|jgi:Fe-S protein assembly chaperone HscA